jgi:hypothetical protein
MDRAPFDWESVPLRGQISPTITVEATREEVDALRNFLARLSEEEQEKAMAPGDDASSGDSSDASSGDEGFEEFIFKRGSAEAPRPRVRGGEREYQDDDDQDDGDQDEEDGEEDDDQGDEDGEEEDDYEGGEEEDEEDEDDEGGDDGDGREFDEISVASYDPEDIRSILRMLAGYSAEEQERDEEKGPSVRPDGAPETLPGAFAAISRLPRFRLEG